MNDIKAPPDSKSSHLDCASRPSTYSGRECSRLEPGQAPDPPGHTGALPAAGPLAGHSGLHSAGLQNLYISSAGLLPLSYSAMHVSQVQLPPPWPRAGKRSDFPLGAILCVRSSVSLPPSFPQVFCRNQ